METAPPPRLVMDEVPITRLVALAVGLGLLSVVIELIVPIPLIKSVIIGFICGRWVARRVVDEDERRVRRVAAWTAAGAIIFEMSLLVLFLVVVAGLTGELTRLVVQALGGWLIVGLIIAVFIETGLAALMAWDTTRRVQRKERQALGSQRSPRADELACPTCGTAYRLADYRADLEVIYCAACKAALPGPGAARSDECAQ
jgi:hypothetical protein